MCNLRISVLLLIFKRGYNIKVYMNKKLMHQPNPVKFSVSPIYSDRTRYVHFYKGEYVHHF